VKQREKNRFTILRRGGEGLGPEKSSCKERNTGAVDLRKEGLKTSPEICAVKETSILKGDKDRKENKVRVWEGGVPNYGREAGGSVCSKKAEW